MNVVIGTNKDQAEYETHINDKYQREIKVLQQQRDRSLGLLDKEVLAVNRRISDLSVISDIYSVQLQALQETIELFPAEAQELMLLTNGADICNLPSKDCDFAFSNNNQANADAAGAEALDSMLARNTAERPPSATTPNSTAEQAPESASLDIPPSTKHESSETNRLRLLKEYPGMPYMYGYVLQDTPTVQHMRGKKEEKKTTMAFARILNGLAKAHSPYPARSFAATSKAPESSVSSSSSRGASPLGATSPTADSESLSMFLRKGQWVRIYNRSGTGELMVELCVSQRKKSGLPPMPHAAPVGYVLPSLLRHFRLLGLLHFTMHTAITKLKEDKIREIETQHKIEDAEKKQEKLNSLNELFRRAYGGFDVRMYVKYRWACSYLQNKIQGVLDTCTGTGELKDQLDRRTRLTIERNQREAYWQDKIVNLDSHRKRALTVREGTLLAACERCDYSKAEALINASSHWSGRRKTFVNTIDPDSGNVALHIACLQGSWGITIADILLKAGADPLLPDQSMSCRDDTALHYATRSGEIKIMELLLDYFEHVNRNSKQAVEKRRELMNVQGHMGRTPLHVATEHGHEQMVRWLLDHDASPHVIQNSAESPLHTAAYRGQTVITKYLLAAKADPRALNARSHSPVFIAALHAHDNLTSIYLDQGVWLSHLELQQLIAVADKENHQRILFMLNRALTLQLQSLLANQPDAPEKEEEELSSRSTSTTSFSAGGSDSHSLAVDSLITEDNLHNTSQHPH